jgi:hypothetical protein
VSFVSMFFHGFFHVLTCFFPCFTMLFSMFYHDLSMFSHDLSMFSHGFSMVPSSTAPSLRPPEDGTLVMKSGESVVVGWSKWKEMYKNKHNIVYLIYICIHI